VVPHLFRRQKKGKKGTDLFIGKNKSVPFFLKPIAAKLQAFALGDSPNAGLTPAEEARLRHRYIHQSAHWNAAKGKNSSDLEVVFINRPTDNNKRVVHPNE